MATAGLIFCAAFQCNGEVTLVEIGKTWVDFLSAAQTNKSMVIANSAYFRIPW